MMQISSITFHCEDKLDLWSESSFGSAEDREREKRKGKYKTEKRENIRKEIESGYLSLMGI